MVYIAIRQNNALPGNPRYQPKSLFPHFGYDNLYRTVTEVELATLRTLAERGIIEHAAIEALSGKVVTSLLEGIITTHVDEVERDITKHDIRAWVRLASQMLDQHGLGHLSRWLHIPLTSYDPLHTARVLQYRRAWDQTLKPACCSVLEEMADLVRKHIDVVQVGRTHGQHALPITVGFWLATILSRICYNVVEINRAADMLTGKISGAVGAYNAQIGLGFDTAASHNTFEESVLEKLGLKPARISTQILPPEPLAYFLHGICMLSASFAQLGQDCRHLMRTEIGEVCEAFEVGQVGSSTMAHKRNPITFEQLVGMWIKTKNEYGKVLDTLLSDHQRDLVGSSVERDFPTMLVNLQCQLDALLRKNKVGVPFLRRISIDTHACQKNLGLSRHVILSEPLYISLIMGGYEGDAHELVNRTLTPRAQKSGRLLIEECELLAQEDEQVTKALNNMTADVKQLLHYPEHYVGRASEKALATAGIALLTVEILTA